MPKNVWFSALQKISPFYIRAMCIFTSRVSGRGNIIGLVCSVSVSVCLCEAAHTGVKTGFAKKVWKVRKAKLCRGFTQIVKRTLKGMVFAGGLGILPQKIFGFEGCKCCTPTHFWVILPSTPKKMIFRFTLNSRMVLGLEKESEIRLKAEDSVPDTLYFTDEEPSYEL